MKQLLIIALMSFTLGLSAQKVDPPKGIGDIVMDIVFHDNMTHSQPTQMVNPITISSLDMVQVNINSVVNNLDGISRGYNFPNSVQLNNLLTPRPLIPLPTIESVNQYHKLNTLYNIDHY